MKFVDIVFETALPEIINATFSHPIKPIGAVHIALLVLFLGTALVAGWPPGKSAVETVINELEAYNGLVDGIATWVWVRFAAVNELAANIEIKDKRNFLNIGL